MKMAIQSCKFVKVCKEFFYEREVKSTEKMDNVKRRNETFLALNVDVCAIM